MRAALIAAALIASAANPVHAEKPDITKVRDFLQVYYGKGDNAYARAYISAVADGLAAYDSHLLNNAPGVMAYCPPGKLGIIDAQYAQILRDFVEKDDSMKDLATNFPTSLALLLALADAFPCKKQ